MAFDKLPKIEFTELDPQKIVDSILSGFERAAQLAGVKNYKLFPGDPRRLFLNTIAYYLVLQNNQINEAGKQNLLPFAVGGFLDNLGALYGDRGKRLPAAYAVTSLVFELQEPQLVNVMIPAGTRVTPGNNLFFATDDIAIIQAGELTATVGATCMSVGTVGNGFIAGQINIIVDRKTPFVMSVSNLTVSTLGADVESDDEYRNRLYLVPESFSTAGPTESYRFWAMSVSQNIADVSVSSPLPGQVYIVVLMVGGEVPTTDILDKVLEVCNDRKRRPLTDWVMVDSPSVHNFDIDIKYFIRSQDVTMAGAIEEAVNNAVNDFVIWSKSALGRDINPSELIRRVVNAGAKRVEITSPAFIKLENNEVAIADNIKVDFGGVESE